MKKAVDGYYFHGIWALCDGTLCFSIHKNGKKITGSGMEGRSGWVGKLSGQQALIYFRVFFPIGQWINHGERRIKKDGECHAILNFLFAFQFGVKVHLFTCDSNKDRAAASESRLDWINFLLALLSRSFPRSELFFLAQGTTVKVVPCSMSTTVLFACSSA